MWTFNSTNIGFKGSFCPRLIPLTLPTIKASEIEAISTGRKIVVITDMTWAVEPRGKANDASYY
ncbi:hypothetical protein GCM10009332_06230 [Shewanella gelidii]|uniref:Uncharacterized protein n=1 Tax=Shewanella gelidii TaxID=1642821 RepID=A0A917N6L8_9GAMM|nr:hypothetical protein GCM10009332_06230 [Shewanella gelidii]